METPPSTFGFCADGSGSVGSFCSMGGIGSVILRMNAGKILRGMLCSVGRGCYCEQGYRDCG